MLGPKIGFPFDVGAERAGGDGPGRFRLVRLMGIAPQVDPKLFSQGILSSLGANSGIQGPTANSSSAKRDVVYPSELPG